MSLIDFLLARIAEDEEWLANQSGDLEWCQECAFGSQPESPYSLSRISSECEAKRQIVEAHAEPHKWCGGEVYLDPDAADCDTLRFLALPYADHPDYDERWRP